MKLQLLRLPTTFERFTEVIPDFTAFENLKGVKKKKKRAKMCQYNKILSQITSDIANVSCEKKPERITNQNKTPPLTKTKYSTFCF